MDNTKPEKKDKKLTLTVSSVETLETRVSPNTVCPGSESTMCCRTTNQTLSAKLTAVAFF